MAKLVRNGARKVGLPPGTPVHIGEHYKHRVNITETALIQSYGKGQK